MKGQYISTMTVFVMIFIVTGNIFGAIIFQESMREKLDYNIGGFNALADAQIRANHYVPKMSRELNYSSNIIAQEFGAGDESLSSATISRSWGTNKDPSVPPKEAVRRTYLSKVRQELKSQQYLSTNCEGPEIATLETEKPTVYQANLEKPYMKCSRTGVKAGIKIEQEKLKVKNSKNRYLPLAYTATDIAQELNRREEEILPQDWSEGTGSASGSFDSDPSASQERQVQQDAIENAKEDAIQNSNLAQDIISELNTQIEDWIGIETHSSFKFSSPEQISENIDEDKCDNDDPPSCDPDYTYETTYQIDVSKIILRYRLSDSQREVLNQEAEFETVDFWFEYVHPVE